MSLSNAQIHQLRGLTHALNPTVMVGAKGLTDAVVAELDLALTHHELVKVQIAGQDRTLRAEIAATLAERTASTSVQKIGRMVCLYRRHPDQPKIIVPG